jgi:NADPH-dependent 2,4-dienoyl-CoA reductase/sulfur reductase-like enzyme
MARTLIVGAGQAGRRTAEALRALDPAAEITLIGADPHLPYDRPPLSKAVLLGTPLGTSLTPRNADYFATHRIALRLGEPVAALDLPGHTVRLAGGESLAWDHLVLATGARARPLAVPGADDPRVLLLRTLEDAERLKAALAAPGPAGGPLRVAVVGGGLIGLEVAASARRLGCAVTVLEAADRLLARGMPAAIADLVAGLHRAQGVELRLGTAVRAVVAAGVETAAGLVPADVVVVGVGAIPETALAEAAGIACEGGILADPQGRTSAPDVYAAGEVARFPCGFLGQAVRRETWQVAQTQPAAVARAICGQPGGYEEVPWFWTDQFGWNIQVFGAAEAGVLLLRPEDAGRRTALALADGVVVGGVLINNGREATPLRRLIAARRAVDATRAADPEVPLREL